MARSRFSRVSPEHKAMLMTLSNIGWKQFKVLTQKNTNRLGVGSNVMRQHVANMSKAHGKQGHSKEWFDERRRVWAAEGKQMKLQKTQESAQQDVEASNNPLTAMARRSFHRSVRKKRARRAALRTAIAGGNAEQNLRGRDRKTHWGMGTKTLPLDPDLLEATLSKRGRQHDCGKRGGLRKLATHLLTEFDLVVTPNNIRLEVHRDPPCNQKHFGFCRQRDLAIQPTYDQVLRRLKTHQRAKDAGALVLRFRPVQKATGDPIEGYNALAHDRYMTFSWHRGNPKYAAFYMQMRRVPTRGTTSDPTDPHDFPFYLEDKYAELPAIPEDEFELNSLTSSEMWNAYQCAKEVAFATQAAGDNQSVAMEVLNHDVQTKLARVSATAVSEVVTTDVLEAPPTKEKTEEEKKVETEAKAKSKTSHVGATQSASTSIHVRASVLRRAGASVRANTMK